MKKRRKAEVPNEQAYEEIQLKGYYRNYAFEADEDDVDAINRANCSPPSRALNNDQSPNNSKSQNNLPSMSKSSRLTESSPRVTYSSTASTSEQIINLKNVYFKYNQKQDWVLNGLQLSVATGRIYALLGAEDSGKTTIVKLIVGLLRPTSGTVRVFDHQVIGQMNYGIYESKDDGLPRQSIGYLPASDRLALYEHFSIQEFLTFYGRLYLMSHDEIELRIKQLTCQLQFSCAHQRIGELSKSEKQLIGLAGSIIHNPALIVLDQPTSSLAPEATQLVWQLLSKQVASSILITSAHFEEARKFSDQVGFLRKGKLLAEKSTEAFLTGYRVNRLEQVYLKLCKLEKLRAKSTMDPVFLQIKQAVDKRIEDNCNSLVNSSINSSANSSDSSSDARPSSSGSSSSSFPCPSDPPSNRLPASNLSKAAYSFTICSSSTVFGSPINHTNKQLDSLRPNRAWLIVFLSLLLRNLRRCVRSPSHLLVQFLLPACQLILFYFAFGRDPHGIPVGVINDDRPRSAGGQPAANLSRLFISTLDDFFIKQIDYARLEDAIRDVKRNRLHAIVHIGSQFSGLLNERLLLNDNLTRKEIERSTIFLHADQTNRFLADFVQRTLLDSFDKFLRQLTDSGRTDFNRRVFHLNGTRKPEDVYYLNSSRDAYHLFGSPGQLGVEKFKNIAYSPFDFREAIFGAPQNHPEHKVWRDFTVPRLVANIVFTLSFVLSCVQFIREREEANFERQFMANCTPVQIVLSYSLIQLAFSLPQIALLLALSAELFSLTVVSSYFAIVCLILLVSASGLSLGLFASLFFRRSSTVVLISGISHFYLLIISGCLWPLAAYPKWARYFGLLQPTNLPSQNLENLFFRASSISHSGFLISSLYAALFGYLSVRRFRFLSIF